MVLAVLGVLLEGVMVAAVVPYVVHVAGLD